MCALARARADTLRALKLPSSVSKPSCSDTLSAPQVGPRGPGPRRWLSAVVWPTPVHPIAFHEDVRAMNAHTTRLQRLDQDLQDRVTSWRLPPTVEALQALRGVQATAAVTIVAELGDLTRFESFRELMQFLGLMPSAYTSAEQRRQGAITQAGHTQARRALVAGAWASHSPAKVSRHRQRRLEKPPKFLQEIRGKAQGRLWKRYRQLRARGQHATVVTVAMAREWAGFMWAIAQQVPVTLEGPDSARHSDELRAGWPPCIGRDTAPVWGHPRQRYEARGGHSSLERGRHPTDVSKVVANPRTAAGATVVAYWLRLCRCTEDKKDDDDLKEVALNS
jgi:Transposase IS116/IS110/IS902 family